MKKLGVLIACVGVALAGIGMLGEGSNAEAGKKGSNKPSKNCAVEFGTTWGLTIAKAQSYGQVTGVDVDPKKFCGKVYFTANKSSRYPKLYKGKEYYLENCCGKVSGPYEVRKNYGGNDHYSS
jgi:hypothetical protein